jgi:hypothetical protein
MYKLSSPFLLKNMHTETILGTNKNHTNGLIFHLSRKIQRFDTNTNTQIQNFPQYCVWSGLRRS